MCRIDYHTDNHAELFKILIFFSGFCSFFSFSCFLFVFQQKKEQYEVPILFLGIIKVKDTGIDRQSII